MRKRQQQRQEEQQRRMLETALELETLYRAKLTGDIISSSPSANNVSGDYWKTRVSDVPRGYIRDTRGTYR